MTEKTDSILRRKGGIDEIDLPDERNNVGDSSMASWIKKDQEAHRADWSRFNQDLAVLR